MFNLLILGCRECQECRRCRRALPKMARGERGAAARPRANPTPYVPASETPAMHGVLWVSVAGGTHWPIGRSASTTRPGSESRHLPARAAQQSLNPLGENRRQGSPLPPSYDGPVDSNQERGGNLSDSKLTG